MGVSFLIKLQAEYLQLGFKKTPAQVFSCVYCENFNNTFLTEHIRATASALHRIFLCGTFDHLIGGVTGGRGQVTMDCLSYAFSENAIKLPIISRTIKVATTKLSMDNGTTKTI